MTGLVVLSALRSEELALRGAVPGARVLRCGMGADRVTQWRGRLAAMQPRAVVVAGVAGGLDATLHAGDVVVADAVIDVAGRRREVPAAAPLVAQLRATGLRVRSGPIVASDRVVTRAGEYEHLARTGALAVDMESFAWVAACADELPGVPVAVVRVVVDTPTAPMLRPHTVTGGIAALRVLRRTGSALEAWGRLPAPRRVLLAGPRSFCAGVERAIDIVEAALQRYRHPVYVRRQIVHNQHVVDDLERRGAIFVQELDEVPDEATVVFSAHGVAPSVRAEAARRGLTVIDATCPLVAKVHAEARRFAARGDTVFLVGHRGHDEVEGTLGEAPERIHLVQDRAEAERVSVENAERVAYVLQTTLAVDEAAETVDALRRRFPQLAGSPTDDICYATTNRQRAVVALAEECDLVIVLGSANSSNSQRLVEVVRRSGTAAHLVEDATGVRADWLEQAATVGVTAGASAPPRLVDEVVATLRGLSPVHVEERVVAQEDITFTLPRGVAG